MCKNYDYDGYTMSYMIGDELMHDIRNSENCIQHTPLVFSKISSSGSDYAPHKFGSSLISFRISSLASQRLSKDSWLSLTKRLFIDEPIRRRSPEMNSNLSGLAKDTVSSILK